MGAYYRQLIEATLPDTFVGSIYFSMGVNPPEGTLLCDGSAVSRTTYADLFEVLGTSYGVGDGSTTFNLPSYGGQFLRFFDHGNGADPDSASRTDRGDGTTGNYVGTKQADNNKIHTHTHPNGTGNSIGGTWGNTGAYDSGIAIGYSGGNEFRPININILTVIGY